MVRSRVKTRSSPERPMDTMVLDGMASLIFALGRNDFRVHIPPPNLIHIPFSTTYYYLRAYTHQKDKQPFRFSPINDKRIQNVRI